MSLSSEKKRPHTNHFTSATVEGTAPEVATGSLGAGVLPKKDATVPASVWLVGFIFH